MADKTNTASTFPQNVAEMEVLNTGRNWGQMISVDGNVVTLNKGMGNTIHANETTAIYYLNGLWSLFKRFQDRRVNPKQRQYLNSSAPLPQIGVMKHVGVGYKAGTWYTLHAEDGMFVWGEPRTSDIENLEAIEYLIERPVEVVIDTEALGREGTAETCKGVLASADVKTAISLLDQRWQGQAESREQYRMNKSRSNSGAYQMPAVLEVNLDGTKTDLMQERSARDIYAVIGGKARRIRWNASPLSAQTIEAALDEGAVFTSEQPIQGE